jgi:hypothetical protein
MVRTGLSTIIVLLMMALSWFLAAFFANWLWKKEWLIKDKLAIVLIGMIFSAIMSIFSIIMIKEVMNNRVLKKKKSFVTYSEALLIFFLSFVINIVIYFAITNLFSVAI